MVFHVVARLPTLTNRAKNDSSFMEAARDKLSVDEGSPEQLCLASCEGDTESLAELAVPHARRAKGEHEKGAVDLRDRHLAQTTTTACVHLGHEKPSVRRIPWRSLPAKQVKQPGDRTIPHEQVQIDGGEQGREVDRDDGEAAIPCVIEQNPEAVIVSSAVDSGPPVMARESSDREFRLVFADLGHGEGLVTGEWMSFSIKELDVMFRCVLIHRMSFVKATISWCSRDSRPSRYYTNLPPSPAPPGVGLKKGAEAPMLPAVLPGAIRRPVYHSQPVPVERPDVVDRALGLASSVAPLAILDEDDRR